jgi:uncharacterized protein (DUF58 family)
MSQLSAASPAAAAAAPAVPAMPVTAASAPGSARVWVDYEPKGAHRTRVRRRPGLDFSVTGLVFVAMMLFMGLAAINSQANLLFGVFGLMIGILIVSYFISLIVLRRLSLKRVVPDHAVVGQPMPMSYEFHNNKRFWPSLSVCLSELDGAEAFTKQPMCYMLHAASGMTASVPAELVPKRRGLHEFDQFQLSTSFPFGFIKRALTVRHKDRLLVLPALADVDRRLLSQCRSAEKTGAMMRPKPGGDDEFYGVKEFRNGESPRRIYWRRSARTGTLVTKQMTQVAPPRIVLLVDTFLHDRSLAQHVLVEKTIAMAGSLASAALAEGLAVGLYVWSGDWTGIHPTRGKRQRDDLLSVLARLPLNRAKDSQALLDTAGTFLKPGTTPVLVTPRDVQLGLADRVRGAMVVVSAASPQAEHWFRFAPHVDFATCMPPDQQPKIGPEGTKGRRHGGTKGAGPAADPTLRASVP